MSHVQRVGQLTATGSVTLECPGQGTCALQIAGAWVGTLVFEVSLTQDDWTLLAVTPSNASTPVTGTTANGLWSGSVAGMQAVRVRCSAYTSGGIDIQLQAVLSAVSELTGLADGADVTEGAIADVAVTGDNAGTVSAKLRGLSKILADVWSSADHWLKVSIQNASIAVTQAASPWSVAQDSASLFAGSTSLTPQHATIAASASGATTIVAAVGGKSIKVVGYVLIANGTVNVKFQSHVSPTDITGLLYLAANTGAAPAYMPVGHFKTVIGEALDINLSANVAVGGHLTYVTV